MKRVLTLSLLLATLLLSSCVKQTFVEPDFEQIEAVSQLPECEEGFTGTKSVVNETSDGFQMIWGTSESIGVYGNSRLAAYWG